MLIIFLFWNFHLSGNASITFNCYDNPYLPVTAYQAGSLNCPSSLSDTKGVFCVYSALCEPLTENQKPTILGQEQIEAYINPMNFDEFQKSSFKNSLVTCAGKGRLEGKWLNADCPALNDCAKDIAFNGTAAAINGRISLKKPAGKVLLKGNGITK